MHKCILLYEGTDLSLLVVSLSAAKIGFESQYYTVKEGSPVLVCAVVSEPDILCPISYPFNFSISTRNHIASKADD